MWPANTLIFGTWSCTGVFLCCKILFIRRELPFYDIISEDLGERMALTIAMRCRAASYLSWRCSMWTSVGDEL